MTTEIRKSTIVWLIIAAALAGFFVFRVSAKNQKNQDLSGDKITRLAQCLTQKDAKMYGAVWCGHCQNQKKAFGQAWSYVTYIECSNEDGTQKETCQKAGIQGYPTWEFGDGSRVSGEISLEDLAKKVGCAY